MIEAVGVFGDQLKEAREARGLSLEAIADATRIAPHHLAALERGDVEALPAGPFAKGYIEGYAGFLGIDPGPILQAFRREGKRRGLDTPEAQDRIIEELSRLMGQREELARRIEPTRLGRRLVLVLLAVVTVGALGYGGWILSRDPDSPAIPPPPPPAEARHPIEDAPGATPVGSRVAPSVADAASPAATAGLEIAHSGVGSAVEGHELVDQGDRFPEGSRVVFWTHVLGGGPGDVVHHVWLHAGEVVMRADLAIGSPSWRTHSRRLLDPGLTGPWVVEARRPDGAVLARHEFVCVPAEGP